MKDYTVLSLSVVMIGAISWFFFGKKENKNQNKEISGDVETIQFNISGMHCASCATSIEATLKMMDGIKEASVNFATSKGIFTFDPKKITKEKIVEKIRELGYDASFDLEEFEKEKLKEVENLKKRLIISFSLFVILILSIFFPFQFNNYIQFIIATVVQFYGGYEIYKSSISSLKNRIADMNLLVTIGTFSAYFYSVFVLFFPNFFPENMRHLYFEGSTAIISFVLLGGYLEQKTKLKATDFMKNLLTLKPTYATIIVDGKEYNVPAENVVKGDTILVKPGDKIPVDGVVLEGSSEVDQSFLTGESVLVFKTVGDEVFGGSINKLGMLKIKATKNAKDNLINQMINLLLEAQSKKPKIGYLADKITQIFVPSVLIFSIAVFNLWYYLGYPLNFSFITVLSVLVIACPCALGLATPIAIVNIVGRGAKEGFLYKNPEVTEKSENIGYAVFDKTGTLTEGRFEVNDTLILSEKYLPLVLSLEKNINHPISQALIELSENLVEIIDKNVIPGEGVVGSYEGKSIAIGNIKLLDNLNISISKEIEEFYKKNKEKGNTVVFGIVEKEVVAVFSLSDKLKKEAYEVIDWFKKHNIKTILLTGDNETVAKNVADKLKIDEVYWELKPVDKYNFIKNLKEKDNKNIVFIGDGINDAPAMVESDIGIAVESATDIAKDSGDILLLKSDIYGVVKSIILSQKGLKIIKENLFWAYIYNLIGILIAAGFLYPFFNITLNPMYAGIAMSFSSITVVLNALRIKKISLK